MAQADYDRTSGPSGSNGTVSIGDLVKGLSDDVSRLMSQHIALAKAEISDKAKQAGIGAGMFGGAGIVGLMALGAFTTALIAAIAVVLPVWAAALIVSGLMGAVSGILFLSGKTKIGEATPAAPHQTVESARETKDELQRSWSHGLHQ